MPEENEIKLDPWGRPEIKDYSRLYEVFGIRPFEEVIGRMNNDCLLYTSPSPRD